MPKKIYELLTPKNTMPKTCNTVCKYAPIVLSAWISFVFIQSLFFKFTDSPETQHIFGTIGAWMEGFSFLERLASPFALYGGYVIGTAELIASGLLIYAIFTQNNFIRNLGAFLSFCIISGAIFFHLATPLGVNVQDDGGALFVMAVSIWISSLILILITLKEMSWASCVTPKKS